MTPPSSSPPSMLPTGMSWELSIGMMPVTGRFRYFSKLALADPKSDPASDSLFDEMTITSGLGFVLAGRRSAFVRLNSGAWRAPLLQARFRPGIANGQVETDKEKEK